MRNEKTSFLPVESLPPSTSVPYSIIPQIFANAKRERRASVRKKFRVAFELQTFRRLSQGYISTSKRTYGNTFEESFERKRKVRVLGYRNAFSLSVYVLRSISLLSKRLPLRLHYCGTPLCYGSLWPRDMYL